jgi:uncharacterized membrane protein YfcA
VLTVVGELLLLAVGAGFIGSISGLGGGVFIVPGLTLLGHVPIHVAIGASLISVVATSAGASAAFVRDGWTNLRVAMALEVATVTGALIGASLAGVLSGRVLELLFAAMMLVSAYFAARRHGEHILPTSDRLAERLKLGGSFPESDGSMVRYGVRNLPGGAAIMVVAGLMSGMLGIGAGALKVVAMDSVMGLPLKVSSATSNFMIGVTAGAGALVFLSRGDVSVVISSPVALGVTAGALIGSRMLMHARVEALRLVFIGLLLLIAVEMGWRALGGI